MKRVFIFLVMLVVASVVLGFYQGWFTMSTEAARDSNKVEVNLTVDPDKARDDAEEFRDNVLPESEDVTTEGPSDGDSSALPVDGSLETDPTDRASENHDVP